MGIFDWLSEKKKTSYKKGISTKKMSIVWFTQSR